MSVHVDELHTDLVPASGERDQRLDPGVSTPGVNEERWRETRCEVDRLTRRVAAEGFDD